MAAGNTPLRTRRKNTALDIAKEPVTTRARAAAASNGFREETARNRRKMEHLELIIATAGAAARHERLMNVDYVPAEKISNRRASTADRRPHHRMELERRRSAALVMQVIMLFVVTAAVVGWMNQRFHFFG